MTEGSACITGAGFRPRCIFGVPLGQQYAAIPVPVDELLCQEATGMIKLTNRGYMVCDENGKELSGPHKTYRQAVHSVPPIEQSAVAKRKEMAKAERKGDQ